MKPVIIFSTVLLMIINRFSEAMPCCVTKDSEEVSSLSATETSLRIIRVQMGNQDGDGMDGGFLGHQNLGGGRFKFKFCFLEENRCCETENLNTDDDNWEKGHVNYFVGQQIDECENFPLAYEGNQHDLYKRVAKMGFF